jgi:hypothetical protein
MTRFGLRTVVAAVVVVAGLVTLAPPVMADDPVAADPPPGEMPVADLTPVPVDEPPADEVTDPAPEPAQIPDMDDTAMPADPTAVDDLISAAVEPADPEAAAAPAAVEVPAEVEQAVDEAATPAQAATTVVMFLIDVSARTAQGSLSCGDVNHDGHAGTILDCELAAAIALVASFGDDPGVRFGVMVFAATAVLLNFANSRGQDFVVSAAGDSDGDGIPDIIEALTGIDPDDYLNLRDGDGPADFGNALAALSYTYRFLSQSINQGPAGEDLSGAAWRAYLLSPGQHAEADLPNRFEFNVLLAEALARLVADGLPVFTYAVGGGLSTGCEGSDLGLIAATTGGSCVEYPPGAQTLPRTGTDLGGQVEVGAALLGLGVLALVLARRRQLMSAA